MSRCTLFLAAALLVAGCAEPAPSATPTPTPTPTPSVAPTPTPEPATLEPVGRLLTTSETPITARTQLNLLLPKGSGAPVLIGDGSRLYFIAAPTIPRTKGGASNGADYALYVFDPADTTIHRVTGTVAPRELGRPKESASETAPGSGSWSIRYAGGVCYRANGSYTSTKPLSAYLYAYDRRLSLEAAKGERGRCIFSEFPLYAAAVAPWAAGTTPARLCPPDRSGCETVAGTLEALVAGPVYPRALTDVVAPVAPVTLFTTRLTAADGSVQTDTLRYLKSNGTGGEVRYGGRPLDGVTSVVISGPDGLLYLIARPYGGDANSWFLARLDPADPRLLTELSSAPER